MKKLLLLFGGMAGFCSISAQTLSPQVIASSGTSLMGASAGLDFTIGEPLTTTVTSSGAGLSQGFHQPRFTIVAVEDHLEDFAITVYPNPVNDYVTVECSRDEEMRVYLFDANGKALLTTGVFTRKTRLDMQNVANGPYLMRITTPTGVPIKSYSIVKTTTN